jgi:hypothetical protein
MKSAPELKLYAIRRKHAWQSTAEAEAAAARSKQVADDEFPTEIRWIRSYVIAEEDGSLGTSASTRRAARRPSASTRTASACRPTTSWPSQTHS